MWVHTEPKDGEYRGVDQRNRRDVLRPTKLPGIEIKLAELFTKL